jgi:hypothetical protein
MRTIRRLRAAKPQHALLAGHEIKQNPRWQQRKHGNDLADRARQREQWISGHGGQRDDGRAERAVGNRRVVGDRSYTNGIEIRNTDSD